jgi:alpha/beta hydrolase family protein
MRIPAASAPGHRLFFSVPLWLVSIILLAGTIALSAQAPLPLPGQQRQPAPPSEPAAVPKFPDAPTVVPAADVSAEVTSPGEMFPSLMSLPSGETLTNFTYEAREYFVSGTAQGRPYRTRIVVRRPRDPRRFSGIVVAESMHPSGNAWMFHFTHKYTMTSGHAAVEILTSNPAQLVVFNQPRYADVTLQPVQAADIIAQVGALVRSARRENPLNGFQVRHLILAGTSASAGVLVNYLPAHMVYRLSGMKPIYDGFLPTSNAANIRPLDVPLIQVPTTTEASRGTLPERHDGDAPGDQYRAYEFPGMPHLDTRDVEAFRPNPCKHPISMFPLTAYMSVALHHLVQWVDKGTVPPRAERILLDREAANDGSPMALDEAGNPRGGIRSPYVDVPVAKYGFPNEGAVPPTPNTVSWVALRGEAGIDQLCRLTGYQIAFNTEELRRRYGSKQDYLRRIRTRLDALTKEGWSLPLYRDQILADAERVTF